MLQKKQKQEQLDKKKIKQERKKKKETRLEEEKVNKLLSKNTNSYNTTCQ